MTVHYRWPSWMSVKTTLGAEDGLGGSKENRETHALTSLLLESRGV